MQRVFSSRSIIIFICMFITGVWATETIVVNHPGSSEAPGESSIIRYMDYFGFWQTHNSLWFRETTEVYWDDGTPEAFYIVTSPPGIYDRMAVKFRPPYSPPMKVISGRFYTDNDVIPLQSFSVCRDAGGYPDVFNPVDQVDTVYGGYPGWGSYEFHGALFDTNDVWAVVHWIPGYVVGIGADSTSPDGFSYWCSEKTVTNWNLWTATDWMMRLSIAEVSDSHDVTCVSLLEPPGRFLPGDTAHPAAVFGNCGLAAETFDVTFDIYDSTNTLVYTATDNITLTSAEIDTVTFMPEWVCIDEGMYDYITYTSLSGDIDPANDTIYRQGLCSREIIITYCGDYTNMGSAIIGTWATNRKYMVRMTPPVSPPYYLQRGQVFLCEANAPVEYVCVCPDNGSGLPDTTTIYAIDYDISTSPHHTWATAYFGGVEVTQPGDVWIIEKWYEGITEPHIGMEITNPSTERSWRYYFRNGAGHYENMGVDPYFREWYFRLIITVPPLGIEEEIASSNPLPFSLLCQPNPAKDRILISYTTAGKTDISLRIYDIAGRLVKHLSGNQNRSVASVYWDCTSDNGQKLPAGIYLVRLETPGMQDIEKVILVR